MRASGVSAAGEMRFEDRTGPRVGAADDAGRLRPSLSIDAGSALWQGDPRLEGVVRAGGIEDPASGSLSCRRQRPSGPRGADGGAVGPAGSDSGHAGPCFDQAVGPGGYAWWYVDAVSDDRRHGVAIIAFVGSVFSPYYAWAGRRDPVNHCAVNVALYGPRGSLWAMTERGRSAVTRNRDALVVGPSSLSWDGGGLRIDIDECTSPIPRRIRGRIEVRAEAINPSAFVLEWEGGHWWRPLVPRADVAVEMEMPAISWRGAGYVDQNAGGEPLERAFSQWTWSRGQTRDGATILYDAARRREPPLSLALRFDRQGGFEHCDAPAPAALPLTRWRLPRRTHSDDGRASLIRPFEDTPFYARSLIRHSLYGQRLESVHESLSLDRFSRSIVRLMLPFRMPRR
jgi:carotenoid 1,2-hydratase